MHVVKGCLVRRHDHLTRKRHSRDKITATIEVLKPKLCTALLAVESLSAIYGAIDVVGEVKAAKTPNWFQWTENDSTDYKHIALILYKEG